MKVTLQIIGVMVILGIIMISLRMCGDTQDVVQKEFSPSAMLHKYEYFKDLSSAIDEKRATIEVYESQVKEYKDHTESFQYQQLMAEMTGLIAMHNRLCAEYNSAMSKFNYAFCNKGELPATNLEPLPREIKPYITNTK